MQTLDCRPFNWIVLPFPSSTTNRKQANRSIIHANLSGIQANWSADFPQGYND